MYSCISVLARAFMSTSLLRAVLLYRRRYVSASECDASDDTVPLVWSRSRLDWERLSTGTTGWTGGQPGRQVENWGDRVDSRDDRKDKWITGTTGCTGGQQRRQDGQVDNRDDRVDRWTTETTGWTGGQQSQQGGQVDNRDDRVDRWTTETT